MVKTQAPLRISFAGGGTDISPYCEEHGGAVLSAAIKKYAAGTYPTTNYCSTDLEKTITGYFGIKEYRLSAHSECLPRSGLGGSAACFVAGIKAVKPDIKPEKLAELAIDLERNVLGVKGGKQDQYAAVYGGLNYMTFNKEVKVERLPVPEGLESLLLLVYMGTRVINGHDIIKDQMERDNIENFAFQKNLALSMKIALAKNDLAVFGRLLDMAWYSKLRFSPFVGTPEICAFHKDCLEHGAIGGKLTGAGGGGYMLLMEHPVKKGELREYFTEKRIVFQKVEFDLEGVKCL